MAVTAHFYPKVMVQTGVKAIALTVDTMTAGLCTGDASAWTTTQWAFQFVTDITGAYTEVTTGGGYTSGYANRQALTTFTHTQQAAGNANIVSWTCTAPAPISFGASTTISARSMFINNKTAGGSAADASSMVMTIIDFGQTVVSTAGAFTYTVAAAPNGLVYWTQS
jgi:hypothetical protein